MLGHRETWCSWVLLASACARPSPAVSTHLDPAPRSAIAPAPAGQAGEPAVVPLGMAPSLAILEDNLQALDFAIRFDIEAEGAVQARFVGELRSVGDTMSLRANGSFDGKPVELSLTADGQRLKGKGGTGQLDVQQPAALEEAVVIGLLRMGILHNLAVLMGARPPDHADGGVGEWVVAEDVVAGASVGPTEPTEAARRESPSAMSFGIVVAGRRAGDATLWWDPASKLPLERHQVVRFPGGEMRVRETYVVEPLRRSSG